MTATRPVYRLGTRASPLAMAQAHMAKAALMAVHGWDDARIEICPVTTLGDRVLDRPLAEIGGKALWTKPIDAALLAGTIDFAVHSMKDVETVRPAEIALVAMLERADVRDKLIGADSIAELPEAARVGTSSPRRAAQLKHLRPDLEIVGFRGNVATRLARLERGEADATLLAAAGLDRLDQSDVGVTIAVAQMIPAASQGAIGIEARADDHEMQALLAAIDHGATSQAVRAERALLAALNADCHSPVGAHAQFDGPVLTLTAQLLSGDGAESVADSIVVEDDASPATLARTLLGRASPAVRALFG
ncbi:MAG: hydroxymethylbilane synthase [Sphingomonadaceae bacterium]